MNFVESMSVDVYVSVWLKRGQLSHGSSHTVTDEAFTRGRDKASDKPEISVLSYVAEKVYKGPMKCSHGNQQSHKASCNSL